LGLIVYFLSDILPKAYSSTMNRPFRLLTGVT
jgi:hypothetical protein